MIDLHMHSRYSDDGQLTPYELVEQCAGKGLCMMSVTDHNCARANEEAAEAAKGKGITYIPGIEIDCTYKDTDFHVLGYGIDFWSSDFERIEKNIEDQSFRASLDRLAETQALGFGHITEKDLWALSQNNYWQGKPCYVKMSYPSMEDILSVIHRNHGIAVIAHPGISLQGKGDLLDAVLNLGIDGIEAFSSYHSPEQARDYYEIARERNIFATCGSDYHGRTKPSIGIGEHGGSGYIRK